MRTLRCVNEVQTRAALANPSPVFFQSDSWAKSGGEHGKHEMGDPFIIPNRAEVGYHPILNLQSIAYLASMKNHIFVTCVAMSALALSLVLVGCERKVSSEKSSTVSSDGTVKTKDKTVTQSPDGTVTKTEETKKVTPAEKP